MTKQQRDAHHLYYWPDGVMGVLKSDGAYTFIAANGAHMGITTGTLDEPLSEEVRWHVSIRRPPDRYDYAAGGPVYHDEASGTLLVFYHAEIWPDGEPQQFYSLIGMARSTDGGESWDDLGEIVRANLALEDADEAVEVNGGPYVVVDGYFYLYFRDYLADGTYNQLAVARAPVDQVVAAAVQEGEVVLWHKYHEGAWEEPGLGGRSSPLEEGNPSVAWADVRHNEYLDKYILIAVEWQAPVHTHLMYAESADGLNWSPRRSVETGRAEHFYPTIVGLGDDPQVAGEEFYVYYTAATQEHRWDDARLVRRLISVSQGED